MSRLDLGFTGTQHGMNAVQLRHLEQILVRLTPDVVHHGDCIGADVEFHDTVRTLFPSCLIIGHPPENPKKRAFLECDVLWPEKPYMDRNQDIVDESVDLIAAPREMAARPHSGTWATYGRAIKAGRPTYLLLPDGTVFTSGAAIDGG